LKKRKELLYFSSVAHAYTHIVILAIIPLLDAIQGSNGGFDISFRQTWLFASAPIFFFGLGAIPTGYLSDRVGPLKIITAGLCVVIISILLIITAQNVVIFGLALVMLGFGSSFYHPAGLSLVSQVFTKKRGLPMGIHGFLGNVGALSTPVISGIVGAVYGWRSAYMLWLAVGVIILIWSLILLSKGVQNTFIANNNKSVLRSSLKDVVFKAMSLTIILVMLYALLFELAYRGTAQFIPFAARDFHNLSGYEFKIVGGIIVSFLIAVGSISQIIGGKMADRYGNKKPLLALSLLAVFALLLMRSNLFAIGLTINGTTFFFDTLLIGAALFGFGIFGTQPIINKFYAEVTPAKIRGLFYGLMFFLKVGLASFALVALAFIPEKDISYGFYILLAFATGAVIIILFLKDSSASTD
jgi:MFS family permease